MAVPLFFCSSLSPLFSFPSCLFPVFSPVLSLLPEWRKMERSSAVFYFFGMDPEHFLFQFLPFPFFCQPIPAEFRRSSGGGRKKVCAFLLFSFRPDDFLSESEGIKPLEEKKRRRQPIESCRLHFFMSVLSVSLQMDAESILFPDPSGHSG